MLNKQIGNHFSEIIKYDIDVSQSISSIICLCRGVMHKTRKGILLKKETKWFQY